MSPLPLLLCLLFVPAAELDNPVQIAARQEAAFHQAARQALAEHKPLVIYILGNPQVIPGCVVVRWDACPGQEQGMSGVVICLPQPDGSLAEVRRRVGGIPSVEWISWHISEHYFLQRAQEWAEAILDYLYPVGESRCPQP